MINVYRDSNGTLAGKHKRNKFMLGELTGIKIYNIWRESDEENYSRYYWKLNMNLG